VVRQLHELGYKTVHATNAPEAIRQLESGGIDLLFSDVIMPGEMDGMELADLVAERWPSIKVVLTSGVPHPRWNDGSPTSGLRLLAKPYLKDDLARAISEAQGS